MSNSEIELLKLCKLLEIESMLLTRMRDSWYTSIFALDLTSWDEMLAISFAVKEEY